MLRNPDTAPGEPDWAPIGHSAIISCLGDKIEALRILGSRLPLLDSHHAFYILKHSFAILRLTYSLWTAPCFDHPKLLEDYDSVLRSVLKDVYNVHIDEFVWVQACLPVRVGGLGLNSTMQLAPSAFLASTAACANLSDYLFDPVVDTAPYHSGARCLEVHDTPRYSISDHRSAESLPRPSGVLRTGSSTESKEFTDISMGCCGVMDGLITFH